MCKLQREKFLNLAEPEDVPAKMEELIKWFQEKLYSAIPIASFLASFCINLREACTFCIPFKGIIYMPTNRVFIRCSKFKIVS